MKEVYTRFRASCKNPFGLNSPSSEHLFFKSALWFLFLSSLYGNAGFAKSKNTEEPPSFFDTNSSSENAQTYTINFNNISIIEYIRFVSKITNINFVFEEADLQFTVTIVSEEPITTKNIMSALVQELRIHNLSLLEQDNNLLITKTKSVNQISSIISSDTPANRTSNAPIVTRVFRIKNANPSSIASIIRPMTSQDSLIEVSAETRQLIVTDVTTNVDKIATLLASLDTPHTHLEIDTYAAKNVASSELVTLSLQILNPFLEGNPLIFVPQPDTNVIFIVSTPYLIERALAVLEDLDTATKGAIGMAPISTENVFVYLIKYKSADDLEAGLFQIAKELSQTENPPQKLVNALQNMKLIQSSNSLLFIGDTDTLSKVKEILANLDVAGPEAPVVEKSSYIIYKIQYATEQQLSDSLNQMASNMENSSVPDTGLINAIQSMKWIKDTNSLVFTGDPQSLKKVKDILANIDTPSSLKAISTKTTFYIYKIQHANEEQIEESLKQMADNLKGAGATDDGLIRAINSMNWIKETNSLVFTGDEQALKRLAEILPTFDVAPAQTKTPLSQIPLTSHFWMYHPQNKTGDELVSSLQEIGENLKDSGLADPSFLHTIDTMKWVPTTNSLLFTGDLATLEHIEAIVKSIDTPTGKVTSANEVFIYKPKYASRDQLEEALDNLASNLDTKNPSDAALVQTIQSMKWISDNQTFLFKGESNSLTRLKELLVTIDSAEGLTGEGIHTFFLYKLQYAPGDVVVADLQKLAASLSGSAVPNTSLIKTIEEVKWIKENNSLLLTGTTASIDKVKQLIADFDLPGAALPPSSLKSSFFIYKPVHQTSDQIQTSMEDLAADLEDSGLIDPDLLQTISTMRNVKATNSLLFTGTPDALKKVQGLLETIDVAAAQAAPIQHLGNVTFLIYKLQHASATQFMTSLRSFASELDKNNALDKELAQTINTMKWVKETNSILFTGDDQTLQRVETLAKKFDISALGPQVRETPAATYVVYTPKYLNGNELISILCDFEQNLMDSGISDRGLFDTINNLKWIEKTSSLLISGDEPSITKVQALLAKFDIPAKETNTPPSIESIDNTSFLVYKLQYHQGNEIQTALKEVAASLSKTSSANQTLLNAINSLQWVKITNSLLGTGEQEVLTKLRGLIENLDVPLRQVFVEVLILETSLSNTQNFGVQWGSKVQYMTKVGAGTSNFPATNPNNTQSNSAAVNGIAPGLQAINATTFPNANTQIPINTGFDLGVLGDIIMHKGRSFVSLGALVSALQTDTDSTIIMNPKLITQDNNNSSIFIGQNIPYIGSTLANQGNGNLATSNNIEYRDVGLNLSITPVIGNGDIVTLDISNNISAVTQNINGSNGVNGIQTTQSSLTTRVHVPNKYFVVLSGMITDTKVHFKSSIPCLGGIPVIGAAFSENDRGDSKDNIIIFVRPHIINSFEEYKEITEHQEDVYKDQAVLPILKEEFDAGIDVVKTPENE